MVTNGLQKTARKGFAEQFPKPSSTGTQIPTANSVLADFMGSNFPKKQDDQLAKVQAAIMGSVAPVFNLWADCVEQDVTGDSSELIPADVVLTTMKATVSLIGNAFAYVSSQRRENIIKSLPKTQTNLAKILSRVSKTDVSGQDGPLFGEKSMTKVSKRISILENFRKSASTADPKNQGNRFLGKGPAAKRGDKLGRPSWSPAYRGQQHRSRYFHSNRNAYRTGNQKQTNPKGYQNRSKSGGN